MCVCKLCWKFCSTLVVWHKNRIMYLRLWAWLSYICQTLPNILLSQAFSHLHLSLFFIASTQTVCPLSVHITFHKISILPLIFPQIIAKTRRYELRLFFIQPKLLYAHSFLSVDRKYVHFTMNFFFTELFHFHEKIECCRPRCCRIEKTKLHRNHIHSHTHTHTQQTADRVSAVAK